MSSHTSAELRGHLQTFVDKHGVQTEGAKFYSHVLPSPKERTLSERTVIGKTGHLSEMRRRGSIRSRVRGFSMPFARANLLGRSLAEGCRKVSGLGEGHFLPRS